MERPTHSHCGKRTDEQADYEQRNGIEGQPHSTLLLRFRAVKAA
jgi:hypothetical protein